jgi:hypothetical protein
MKSIPPDLLATELLNKQARVYRSGDMLTQDFIPERVNIELSSDNKIVRIWLG